MTGNSTALHMAASVGNKECIAVLLKYRADLHVMDENDKTPFLLAMNNHHTTTAKILKSAGKWEVL